ncbi:MAG: hypothetical protein GY782_06465, partial [Gammaproteobacteria bacterium]|nr:hypothetical protein [Gammaproteobacteria bacterium]
MAALEMNDVDGFNELKSIRSDHGNSPEIRKLIIRTIASWRNEKSKPKEEPIPMPEPEPEPMPISTDSRKITIDYNAKPNAPSERKWKGASILDMADE